MVGYGVGNGILVAGKSEVNEKIVYIHLFIHLLIHPFIHSINIH